MKSTLAGGKRFNWRQDGVFSVIPILTLIITLIVIVK
jgi:hypothetical protein